MLISTLLPHIEALVFATDKPVSVPELTELVNNALSFMDDRATPELFSEALEIIREKYAEETTHLG